MSAPVPPARDPGLLAAAIASSTLLAEETRKLLRRAAASLRRAGKRTPSEAEGETHGSGW